MDQTGRNKYCLSLKKLSLLRCSTTFLLIIAIKKLLVTLRMLMSPYRDGHERMYVNTFLQTGRTHDTILRFWKNFSFMQRLDNFRANILRDNHWDFTCTINLPMAMIFHLSWNFPCCERNITFVLREREEVEKGMALFIWRGLIRMCFVLLDDDEIISGPFMIVGKLLRIWLEIFRKWRDPSRLLSILALTLCAQLQFVLSRTLIRWMRVGLNSTSVLLHRYLR